MKLVAPVLLFAAAAAAFGLHNKPPEAKTTRTDNFTWADPFSSHRLKRLDAACTAERAFRAREFLLHDLFEHEPKGLFPYADALKKLFAGTPYPGGWDGLDPHLYERPLLAMAYSDVPLAVREWIEAQERSGAGGAGGAGGGDVPGKGLFAVFERATMPEQKVAKTVAPAKTPEKAALFRPLDAKRLVLFAPGALYGILPLWVAEGSACKDHLLDLGRYSPKPKAGGVIAWTTAHTRPDRGEGERDMSFTIKAQTLQKAVGDGKEGKEGKEEL